MDTNTKADALDVAAIRARFDETTGGLWSHGIGESRSRGIELWTVFSNGGTTCVATTGPVDHADSIRSQYDAEFIARAHEDVPALCDEVERLRAALVGLADHVERVVGAYPVDFEPAVEAARSATKQGA